MHTHARNLVSVFGALLVLLLVTLAGAFTLARTTFGQAADPSQTIAYARDGELRLIEADGTGDRLLWAAPASDGPGEILGLDWRPDGGALAFAADFEAACSYYASDIYTILADGEDLRRTTNSPLCAEMTGFPTGSVTITVTNQVPEFSLFSLYVQGAQAPTAVTIPPGETRSFTVRRVANLGNMEQAVVIVRGDTRWIDSEVAADILTAKNVAVEKPLVLLPQENAYRDFGASQPSWAYNAARIGFIRLLSELRQISAYPAVAEADTGLLLPEDLLSGDSLAWSPVADEILVTAANGIFLIESEATEIGEPLVPANGTEFLGLDWLPDGSGFVYAQTATSERSAYSNLFAYRFETGESEQLTDLAAGFASHPAVSGDGQRIVFERAPDRESAAELWLMAVVGDTLEPLGVVGNYPDWRPQRTVSFFATFFMPLIGHNIVGTFPSPTPTATNTPTPTATATATLPPTATFTPEPTTSVTAEATSTATPEATSTSTPEATPTVTNTPEATATATATATASPTATATVPPLNLVENGDFEDGPNGDWSESINGVNLPGSFVVRPQSDLSPRSGQYVAWLGGFNNQVHRLSQTVTLPDETSLQLVFWIQIRSNEITCTADSVQVRLDDNQIRAIELCASANTPGWQEIVVDASAFAGQEVKLEFLGAFDETSLSSLFIEDVDFQAGP